MNSMHALFRSGEFLAEITRPRMRQNDAIGLPNTKQSLVPLVLVQPWPQVLNVLWLTHLHVLLPKSKCPPSPLLLVAHPVLPTSKTPLLSLLCASMFPTSKTPLVSLLCMLMFHKSKNPSLSLLFLPLPVLPPVLSPLHSHPARLNPLIETRPAELRDH